MSFRALARYSLVAALIAASFIPQLMTVALLGEVNLVVLAALWAILLTCFVQAGEVLSRAVGIIAALLMAVPPTPNFVSMSDRGLHFEFIGWSNLLGPGGLYGIVFFFAFYALIFLATLRLMTAKGSANFAGS
jgi:hypothetical protein